MVAYSATPGLTELIGPKRAAASSWDIAQAKRRRAQSVREEKDKVRRLAIWGDTDTLAHTIMMRFVRNGMLVSEVQQLPNFFDGDHYGQYLEELRARRTAHWNKWSRPIQPGDLLSVTSTAITDSQRWISRVGRVVMLWKGVGIDGEDYVDLAGGVFTYPDADHFENSTTNLPDKNITKYRRLNVGDIVSTEAEPRLKIVDLGAGEITPRPGNSKWIEWKAIGNWADGAGEVVVRRADGVGGDFRVAVGELRIDAGERVAGSRAANRYGRADWRDSRVWANRGQPWDGSPG